jgi:hypothetical protein
MEVHVVLHLIILFSRIAESIMFEPVLTVLGLAVIETICFPDGGTKPNVLGGSGAFCSLPASPNP